MSCMRLVVMTAVMGCVVVASTSIADVSLYNVTWPSPSQNASGSMPLGNGATSLNAWIEPSGDLCFYIGRTDSWGDNARLLKVGLVRVRMSPAPDLEPFEQTLSLVDATMIARYGKGDAATTLRLWADANEPVIHVTIDAPQPVTATASFELWRTGQYTLPSIEVSDVMTDRAKPGNQHAPTVVEPDTVLSNQNARIGWYHRNIKSVGPAEHARVQGMTEYPGYREDPLLGRTFGAIITAEAPSVERVDDEHLTSPAARRHTFNVYVDTVHPATEATWLAHMDQAIARVQSKSFDARRKAHEQWWTQRWNRSWIEAEQSAESKPRSMIPANQHAIRIGFDQSGGNRFAGSLGRMSIYQRPLSDGEVVKLSKTAPQAPVASDKSLKFSEVGGEPRQIEGSAAWMFDEGMTLDAWVKPDKLAAGGARLFDDVTPGVNNGFLLDTHPGNSVRLIVGEVQLSVKDALPAGRWSHVAAVVSSRTGHVGLYVNGKLVAEQGNNALDDAELVSRGYALQRFIDICAGRGAYPIKFNGSIFTVPHAGKPGDADYRRWGPGYWWQNTRLPYESMCASGDTDLMRPLFAQYIDRFLPINLYRTKHYFNHGGAYYIECVHFWGDAFNEVYGWTPMQQREDKLQVSGWHKWEWVCGLEVAALALDYYEHTGDRAFVKDKAIPTGDAVVRFFDEHYKTGPDGKLVMHPAQALETWWDSTNPMSELAGLYAVIDRLEALDDSLTTADQRAYWKTLRAKLPDLPMRDINGQPAFAPATKFASKRNSENPEMYVVFPFRLASFNRPNAAPAIHALNHRTDKGNHGWRQDDIFMAYLGLTDEARKYLVGRAAAHDKSQRFPAFWGPNYDWTPDQDHGGVLMKAYQSMLMQTEPTMGSPYDGKIYLLPAWPRDWNVRFKLHAPQATILEGEYRDGKMIRLNVTPESRRRDVIIVGE